MGETTRDYYDVLGVPRDADEKTIKDAYHRLAMKWHPDRNKSEEAEERFKEIAKAYAVLHDPSKRARYDASGHAGVAHFSQDELFRGVDLGSLFGDLGFGFGPGGDSIFERFFDSRRASARGQNLRVRLEIPIERVGSGGEEMVHLSRPVTCERCHGHGTHSGEPPAPCKHCGGSGQTVTSRKTEQDEQRTVHIQQVAACRECGGRGTMPEDPCPACGGDGRTERHETLKVKIPAGIGDGMTLRISGHGLPGTHGAPAGDLHVSVFSAADPRFQRRGADLWRSETIEITDAVLGSERTVPTLEGDVVLTIPAGTQPDCVLRLRGKGLPRIDGGTNGDLNVRIQVHVPERMSDEVRELFERLRETLEAQSRRRE